MKKIFKFSWFAFGFIGIIVAVVAFFMLANHNISNRSLLLLLTERGAALINVFERALIINSYGRHNFPLQNMAEEIMIDSRGFTFFSITDKNGKVLVHNNPDFLGTVVPIIEELKTGDFKKINLNIDTSTNSRDFGIECGIIKRDGKENFVIYKEISVNTLRDLIQNNPHHLERLLTPPPRRNRNNHEGHALDNRMLDNTMLDNLLEELLRPFPNENEDEDENIKNVNFLETEELPLYIFIGQDMSLHVERRFRSYLSLWATALPTLFTAIALFLIMLYFLRIKEAQKNQEAKLNALGDLTAGVAHEIRNPLSSIKGYATFFKQKFEKGSTEAEAASIMIEEVDRLNRAIDDLVGLGRSFDVKIEKTNITDVCNKVCLLLEPEAKQREIDLKCSFSKEKSYEIFADQDRLKQAFLNILLNAMEAFENTDIQNKEVSINLTKKSKNLIINIIDNASGMSEETLNRILDPYFTTKSQGTGLGLVIAKNIIEAHKGTLQIISFLQSSSKEKRGTTMQITLPLE